MIHSHFRGTMLYRRAVVQRVAVGCALLLLQACINDIQAGDSTIRGTYTLRTVNGAVLPYTKSVIGATKAELLDDKISLFMGFTLAEEVVIRTTEHGVATTQTIATTGTYALGFNNSVVLRSNSGGSRTVLIDNGNTMTITESGIPYVWKK